MEGLFTLLSLSVVMATTSFLVGSLPLTFTLSPTQLRLISSVGMGVLVGTSLDVIIPEGIETLYSSAHYHGQKDVSSQTLDVRWSPHDVHPAGHNAIPRSSVPDVIMELAGPISATANRDLRTRAENVELLPPDANEGPQKGGHDDQDQEGSLHAWIGVSLVSGFILMYLIDKLPAFAAPSKQQRPPYHISLDNLGLGLQRGSSTNRDGGLSDPGNSPTHSHGFATTTGLVIHAAADGIALGASSSNTNLSFIIFLALLIHKAPASFGLTSVLLKQGLSTRAARGHLLIFSLAAPVGALLTFTFAHTVGVGFGNDEAGTRWWTGMLLLFSAGTFLYVAMHTMQEYDPNSISHDSYVNGYTDPRDSSQRSKKSMRDLIASVVGMILPLFLQIGHAH